MIKQMLKQKMSKFYALYSLLAVGGIASVLFYLSDAKEVDLFIPIGIGVAWMFLIHQAYTKNKQQLEAFNKNYDALTENEKKLLEQAMAKSTVKTKHFYINQFGICSFISKQCVFLRREQIEKAVINKDFYQRTVLEVASGEQMYKFYLAVQDDEEKIKSLLHKYKMK